MASWDPLSMAQDVIRCTLCEDAPAELNCNTCNVGLCDGCVSKHITSKKSKKHDIVPFTSKKSEIKLPECKSHPNIKCELHCRQCKISICLKCVTGPHYKHDIIEISDTISLIREAIQKETKELDTVISEEYEKIKTETKKKLAKLQEDYQSLKKMVTDHGKLWHEELDVVIAQFITDIERMEKEDLATLNKQLTEMENILSEIRNISLKNKQILTSNDSTEMCNHKSRKEEFHKVPTRVGLSPPTFKPLDIEGLNMMKQFGTLTSSIKTELSEYHIKMKESISSLTSVTQLLDVPTEVTTTDTGDDIHSITTVNTDQMWIGRVGCIDHVDIHGTTLQTIYTLSGCSPWGLTVTQEGHLIYTDWDDNTVNLVKRGKIETVIRTGDWAPFSICSTSNGDLLVCLKKRIQHKVVQYSGYKVKQVIQNDKKNKPLFAEGRIVLYIAENRDQNICVCDTNAQTVLVLNQAGKLQFCYAGNLASNNYKPFAPRGIATDSQSQILIADMNNNCVHIINHNGKFIRYIDHCHLDRPVFLSVDSIDQLFVVCVDSKSVKIITYMK